MKKKLGIVYIAGLYLLLGLVVFPAFAASLKQDLDKNLNDKDLSGYKVKGWFYKPEKREFIVYVHDGDNWIVGHAKSPLFPPVSSIVIGTDLIFSDHSAPSPRMYIFKEGLRELFSADPDTIMETIKALKMGR